MPAVNRYYSSVAIDTTLSFSITNSDLTLVVGSTSGFPTSYPYTLAIGYDLSNEELVTIIGASGTTLTVGTTVAGGANIAGRGVDGTSDQAHAAGEPVKHVISARDMTESQSHIAAEAGAHGITGSFVGTTDTQSLTNKTITGGTVNPTTLQQGGVPAVTTTGTQTLTNKTLTAPKVNEDVAVTATATELNVLDGITASTAELNIMDGVTASTAELNILDGVTASAAEINILDGATLSTAELNYVDGVTSSIQAQINALFPKGMVSPFAGSSAPTGWLFCDGSAVSRATYSALFSTISTTYGVGDGSTTFNVPDLRGRTPIGVGTGTGLTARALADIVGVETVTLTALQSGIRDHTHANTVAISGDGAHTHSVSGGTTNNNTHDHSSATLSESAAEAPDPGSAATLSNAALSAGHSHTVSITNVGHTATAATDAHENMQPSLALNYIIKH